MSRRTGPSAAVRELVIQRAEGHCEICCHRGGQIHHRQPRGMGGSSDPAINRPSNLALLCQDCHEVVERNREQSYRNGWLVRQGMDPREVPFLLLAFEPVYLTDDGGYQRASPDPAIGGAA